MEKEHPWCRRCIIQAGWHFHPLLAPSEPGVNANPAELRALTAMLLRTRRQSKHNSSCITAIN